MTDTKDMNSTDRLLNVIRGTEQPPTEAKDAVRDIPSGPKKTDINSHHFFSGLFAGKRRFRLGVDIGQENINFVKMAKGSDGTPLLIEQKIIKIDDPLKRGSTEFNKFLQSALTAFAGSTEECEIWAMMNATEVSVHHLKIPRVPGKQLENVIYWTARKENPIDDKDVIFDYEVQGEIIDQGIPKYAVMVYTAPKSEISRVRNIFSSIDIHLTGITIAPFAIQNIFRSRWIAVGEDTFASLFIGNDFSRIDVYSQNNLVMTRGIKTGISSMMEAIDESVEDQAFHEVADKKRFGKILHELSLNPGKTVVDDHGYQWTEGSVLEMITPALDRLARQIERTLDYYSTSVGYQRVEKIYVSSVLNVLYVPMLNYISEQLGTTTEFFDPFKGKEASVSGSSLPLAERASLVPAIGLSLSDRKRTPNAIFTYVEKKKEIRKQQMNRGIFAVFAFLLIICFIFLTFEVVNTNNLSVQQAKLDKELSLFKPVLSKEQIKALTEDLKQRHQITKQYSLKYKGMALISELSALTPVNVRLIHVKISMPVAGSTEQKKNVPQEEKSDTISVEGVVLGDRQTLDTILAQYVMMLENSPLFRGVTIQKSGMVSFRKKEILQFTIKARLG